MRSELADASSALRGEVEEAAVAVRAGAARVAAPVREPVSRSFADARGFFRGIADKVASARDDVVRTVTLGRSDPEMERISADVTKLRERIYADGEITPQELLELRRAIGAAAAKLDAIAARGAGREGPKGLHARARELREIHFEYLEGSNGREGALGVLGRAPKAQRAARARDVALDIAGSADAETARDKVNLLRASLARVPPAALPGGGPPRGRARARRAAGLGDRRGDLPWDGNILNGAVQFGHGPIGPQEIALTGETGTLAGHFAAWNK